MAHALGVPTAVVIILKDRGGAKAEIVVPCLQLGVARIDLKGDGMLVQRGCALDCEVEKGFAEAFAAGGGKDSDGKDAQGLWVEAQYHGSGDRFIDHPDFLGAAGKAAAQDAIGLNAWRREASVFDGAQGVELGGPSAKNRVVGIHAGRAAVVNGWRAERLLSGGGGTYR